MSGTITFLNPLKNSNTLRRINKKIQGSKSSKKLNYDSEGLYKPLNLERREIRLLHIKPSLKLKERPQCFLETVSLDDNPQFEALSYAWGDPNLTRPIILEDREWYATINLEVGLRYLRSPSEDVVIWVDALCIDGSSVYERNSQVLLMKTIYSNAERVRVWLGEPTRGSDDALAIVEHMGGTVPFKDIRLNGKALDEKHVNYLRKLISRPWWNRVWTHQEYILAKDVTLHCGLRSVGYSTILKLKSEDWLGFTKGWDSGMAEVIVLIDDSTHTYRGYIEKGGHGSSFAVVLAYGCFRDCTDLRDSIYGFLGLAQQDLVHAIRPEYSIPLKEVLRRTAVKHISCTKSLSFFSFTNWKTKIKRLVPTWVPDWPRLGPFDLHDHNYTQNVKRGQWRTRTTRFEMISVFKACATRTLSFDIIDETTVMLSGRCLGQITHIKPNANPDASLQVIESWSRFFDQFANHTAFPSSTEGRESPAWRILVGDRYVEERGAWRTCEPADYEAYQALQHSSVPGAPLTQVAREYWTSFRVASSGRRLFATDRGHIGLGPPKMQKGDHVYILSGGNVPYVLRPLSGLRPRTFELVGDCYLHGVMYGEAAGTDEDYHDVFLE